MSALLIRYKDRVQIDFKAIAEVNYPFILDRAISIDPTVADEMGDFLNDGSFGRVIIRVEDDAEECVTIGADARVTFRLISFQAYG